MCGDPAPNLCKQCQSSQYCSRECQRADWPVHKQLCGPFTTGPARPNTRCKRGIFFPVDSATPRFVWVPCETRHDPDDDIVWEHRDKEQFLGAGMTNGVWVQRNNTRSRARHDVLTVYVREAASIDGSRLNQCVIAAARGRYVNLAWMGPLLVVRSRGLTLGDSEMVDVDMVDFRDAVDVLCSYPDVNINFTLPETQWSVDAVRVNCEGEMAMYGRAKFELVKLPSDHPVLARPVAGISRLLGIPVRVVMCSPHKGTMGYDGTNDEATALQLDPDPRSPTWGLVLQTTQGVLDPPYNGGNVVVVREDGTMIRKDEAELLCRYCVHVLLPLFGKARVGRATKKRVLDAMTGAAFEDYCSHQRAGTA